MTRFCANCGTEVDDTAVFCPTCGQPIEEGEAAELPAAPSWPDPAAGDPDAARREDEPTDRAERPDETARTEPRGERPGDVPTRVEPRPAPREPEPEQAPEPGSDRRPDSPPERPASAPARESSGPQIDLPITTPVTLSAWLIGIGAVIAALGLIVILVGTVLNVIDLLLLLAFVAIAATVFFSAALPGVPNLRLLTLIVVLIAFGVALDRIGFRGGGVGELLLFLGSAAAAIGAVILELGQDQPLGGAQR